MNVSKFARKVGQVHIPSARLIQINKDPWANATIDRAEFSQTKPDLVAQYPYRFCSTSLREGCYKITVTRTKAISLVRKWEGTLRVENADDGMCISGDLYKVKSLMLAQAATLFDAAGKVSAAASRLALPQSVTAYSKAELPGFPSRIFYKKTIPVFARKRYYAYLEGTGAALFAIVYHKEPCPFTLSFDLYQYDHPDSGYDGSFPDTPTQQVQLKMQSTSTADTYTGVMCQGDIVLGTVSMEWVSAKFRKAYLDIHTMTDAVAPQAVDDIDGTGSETFKTIFDTADWDLRVSYKSGEISVPDSLAGTQDADDCWSRHNLHVLMQSLPGYDATVLDKKWLVRLMAVPGRLDCSRGKMFDNLIDPAAPGDINLVAREGAVTYSDDGYNSAVFGDEENELQRNVPRAFIRSAAHEVGHAFNQIHQSDEGGSDNSIMTVSPGVAAVLNAAGDDFPEDIALSFNERVRHHLIHYPDPAVRPGAMAFTGALIACPEADDVEFFPASVLGFELKPHARNIRLGEPLHLQWQVTNATREKVFIPAELTDKTLIARVSVTYPDGAVRYVRPYLVEADVEIPLTELAAGAKRGAETILFWNNEGFVFKAPGPHCVEVTLLWLNTGQYCGLTASTEVWVDYPLTQKDNDTAALLLHESVGKFVALKGRLPIEKGKERIEKAIAGFKSHPACILLQELPGHRYSKVKPPVKSKGTK